jgi:hypothetical protein
MTAFILSGAIGFALYQLLAFAEWPVGRHFLDPLRLNIVTARTVRRVIVAVIVFVILLAVLTIHRFASPVDALASYEVNIIIGFLFGPLLAIWVNSVVVHSGSEDLSRGQILAVLGLAVLFLIGLLGGGEGLNIVKQYSRSISSFKVGVAEVSFSTNDQTGANKIASKGNNWEGGNKSDGQSYVGGASAGLQNLALLDGIIKRDVDYLTQVFTRDVSSMPIDDLNGGKVLAQSAVALPLGCLSAWFGQTADSGLVEKYLAIYGDAFRRLEALNGRAGASRTIDPGELEANLNELSSDFVHNGLRMAVDIAQSTSSPDVSKACKSWFDIYCPTGDKPPGNDPRQCLRAALDQFAMPPGSAKTGNVSKRISDLVKSLSARITRKDDSRGLEALPYFAIVRASVMEQNGQHQAAAAILDNWLHQRSDTQDERKDQYAKDPMLQVKDEWLAMRVRTMLAAYVEEWLDDDQAKAGTAIRTEHLQNLRVIIDGLKARLLKADFFQDLNKSCRTTCTPAIRRPEPDSCESKESPARLKLWGWLYTSYVSMEYTYVHRAIEHPDYARKFAEPVNDEAHRLANFDLSCSPAEAQPDVYYAQSLLGFAENAVAYSRLRATVDNKDTHRKRLDEAEHAVRFGLQITDNLAKDDQERSGKPYLQRVAPSFAVSMQEQLKDQLRKIGKARADLTD